MTTFHPFISFSTNLGFWHVSALVREKNLIASISVRQFDRYWKVIKSDVAET